MTFYAEDVFRVWKKVIGSDNEKLLSGIEVAINPLNVNNLLEDTDIPRQSGIVAIDVSYAGLKPHLEKSKDVNFSASQCTLCAQALPRDGSMSLVCPTVDCNALGHLKCFASHFLGKGHEDIFPKSGNCPGCGSDLQWIDLVKELSLRMRGEKEIEKVLKVKKPRGTQAQNQKASEMDGTNEVSEESESEDAALQDDWHYLSDSSDGDEIDQAPRSDPSQVSDFRIHEARTNMPFSEPIIEESGWDDAEIVT